MERCRSRGDYVAIRLFSAVAARNIRVPSMATRLTGLPERRAPTANFVRHGEANNLARQSGKRGEDLAAKNAKDSKFSLGCARCAILVTPAQPESRLKSLSGIVEIPRLQAK